MQSTQHQSSTAFRTFEGTQSRLCPIRGIGIHIQKLGDNTCYIYKCGDIPYHKSQLFGIQFYLRSCNMVSIPKDGSWTIQVLQGKHHALEERVKLSPTSSGHEGNVSQIIMIHVGTLSPPKELAFEIEFYPRSYNIDCIKILLFRNQ